MTINSITRTFSASGEITENELMLLRQSGVSALINVRPDNESLEQKNSLEWNALCQKFGLAYFYIPVSPCQYSENDIKQFKEVLNSVEGKVHGLCRTGTRAAHLYALAKQEEYTFQELYSLLNEKGYDLNPIASQFIDG